MCHLLPSVRSLSFLWHSDALLVLQNGNGDGTLASRLRVTGVLCFEFQQSSFPALCAWCPWSPVYRRLFFFSSILMSNHFLFTSLNPINLFCTSASRFWIFTLLTDTYVYWHRQTSQNNFHSNLWERLFFLQFIRHFLCVSFAFYGGVLCASPNEIRYAVHTAGNLRVIDIQQHTHAWTNKISISGSHFEFRKLNLPQNWQMRTFFY